MKIEVKIGDSKVDWHVGSIGMKHLILLSTYNISTLPKFAKSIGSGEWMDKATNEVISEMDNCEKKLIIEIELELKKAKDFMKKKYPIRYKLSYWKVIIKNPIKALIAKWLVK